MAKGRAVRGRGQKVEWVQPLKGMETIGARMEEGGVGKKRFGAGLSSP